MTNCIGVGLRYVLLMATLGSTFQLAEGQTEERIGDLTMVQGDVPRRLVGYGLVLGLNGTGDESFGTRAGAVHTVQSVSNMLERFGIHVPPDRMRLRNVAAVTVTAEVSPFLRPGGRFDVQLASAGDARSLKGGILFTTPLAEDVGMPTVATAQGAVLLSEDSGNRFRARGGTSGRIPDGGVVEFDMGAQFPDSVTLVLRQPNVSTAVRIAAAINALAGDGTALVQDPGAVQLTSSGQDADNFIELLASLDTIPVQTGSEARLVVDGVSGSVVAGGNLAVGSAVVTQGGITLTISGEGVAEQAAPGPGVVAATEGAPVQEIAAGLHVAGATPREIAAIFEALRDVGALNAQIVVR